MWFALAIFSSLLFGMAGLFMKVSQMKRGSLPHLLLGLYASGSLGFLLHSLAEQSLQLTDWRVWAAGAVIGAGSAWGNLVFMKALDYGPASLTSPLTNLNIVIVMGMSLWVYEEPITEFGLIGVCLLLTAVILISVRKREPLTIAEQKWFWYVGLAVILFTFRNGGLKITAEWGLPNTPILLIGYVLSALWFGFAAGERHSGNLSSPARNAPQEIDGNATTGLAWGLIAGLFSYGGLQLYSLALQAGPANIVAPIFATNSLIVAIGSIVWFKERLTKPQTAAFVFLISGLALVRI